MIPNNMSELWTMVAPAAINHLWQSTLFAAVAGGFALLLRKNQARARYWLWMAASVKFLIPFSLLVVVGSYMARPSAGVQSTSSGGFYAAMQEVATVSDFLTVGASHAQYPTVNPKAVDRGYPSIPALLVMIWLCGFFAVVFAGFARWRRIARASRAARPLREGREVEALRRMERRVGIRKPVKMRFSRSSLEPGIFGVFRPVLLWPEGMSANLTERQIEAILAHEVWHVRRRDNLMAAVHMAVEAIFWFHPLAWWLGARMIEERERACDEAVVELGQAPRVYAESILKACEFCVTSPIACVSGVTGADLKKRVVRIMTARPVVKLDARKKLLLVLAALLAVAVPVGFGLANGKQTQASVPQSQTAPQTADAPLPSFEVASIKPDRSENDKMGFMMSPGGRFSASGVPARMLIEFAFNLKSDAQLVGAPGWVNTQKFDIDAKADDAFVQKMRKLSFDEANAQMRLMVQSLLADRFNLKVSRETKELPVYALVVAKNGPKITESKLPPIGPIGSDHPEPNGKNHTIGNRGIMMRPGNMTVRGAPIALLANALSRQADLGGRQVVDETGLKGIYDFTLNWTPEFERGPIGSGPGPGGGAGPAATAGPAGPGADAVPGGPGPSEAAPDSSGPSIFTALQQQLGLRLRPAKGPVEVVVIDHIEEPTPN